MIPSTSGFLAEDFTVEEQPSKTYKLNMKNSVITGTCDELEAVRQAIYKALNTERYQHIIYSWDYGVETEDLFGEPVTYVMPELKRRIMEALTQDTRISSVDAFSFTTKKGTVSVSFTVHTIYGDVEAERAVNI
jgi:Protein of unknown function (DUF2634).